MKPDLPKIPQELKALPNWVVWRIENREGKPTKVPYNAAHPKQNAKANVPTTWGTYDEAVKAYEAGSFTGVGYEFSGADPFCGIDLDHCRNPETGEIKESARKIIKKLNSYTEVSPSGTGLHVWVKGLLPPGRRKQGGFEIYSDGRYFTLTGHHLKGTPPTIEDRQAEIEVLHLEIFGAPQARQAPPNPAILLALTDQELIILARQAANGNKFEALWRGDWSRYPSQSEATAALLNMLVFYRGQDPAGVDRLFRQSGLMRDKWDRPQAGGTWGALEVDKAISRATEFYSPRQRSSSPPPTRQAPEGGKDQAKTKQDGVIAELNSKHAVVMLGGKCVILNEVIDPTFNRPDITFSSVNDFRNYYSNRKVKITKEDNKLNIPLSTVWLE